MSFEYEKLENVCEILDSQRVPITEKDRKPGIYPYYGANGVQDYIDDFIFDDELVLLAEDGGNFGSKDKPIAYRVSGKCWVNNHAHVLKAKDNIDIDYLCYSLMFYNTNGLVNGATRQKLTQTAMRQMLIPLRKKDVQLKIVKKINLLFQLIKKRNQQLSKLDQLVKSRFIEMFGDTKNNINNFKIYSIGDICSLKSGTSLPLNVENEGGDIPYIKVSDMSLLGNERYITISSRYVTQRTAGKGIFPVGSVIFPKRGGAIGTNKKRLTQIQICADLNIMGVIPGANITPHYLLSYFDMIDLGKLDNGSSVPQLNNKDIAPLKILLPPFSLQEQFATFVQQVDKAKSSVKQSLEKLETLKKSLMQEYFD